MRQALWYSPGCPSHEISHRSPRTGHRRHLLIPPSQTLQRRRRHSPHQVSAAEDQISRGVGAWNGDELLIGEVLSKRRKLCTRMTQKFTKYIQSYPIKLQFHVEDAKTSCLAMGLAVDDIRLLHQGQQSTTPLAVGAVMARHWL